MEVNFRAVVLDILTEIEKEGEFSHITINNALSKYQYLDRAQRAFINRLALGTIECRIELDYIINQFSKTPVNKMKPVIRRIMRMAVYKLRLLLPKLLIHSKSISRSMPVSFRNSRSWLMAITVPA